MDIWSLEYQIKSYKFLYKHQCITWNCCWWATGECFYYVHNIDHFLFLLIFLKIISFYINLSHFFSLIKCAQILGLISNRPSFTVQVVVILLTVVHSVGLYNTQPLSFFSTFQRVIPILFWDIINVHNRKINCIYDHRLGWKLKIAFP